MLREDKTGSGRKAEEKVEDKGKSGKRGGGGREREKKEK